MSQRRNAPTRSQLIHALIMERARTLAINHACRTGAQVWGVSQNTIDEARKQIEAEVLTPRTP